MVGNVIIENGLEYEILLDKSTNWQERYTLQLKDGLLPEIGRSFVMDNKQFRIVYVNTGRNNVTIVKNK